MKDWVGQTIEARYVVTARLGAGGMAAVYRAEDLRLNRRPVALKHPLRDQDRVAGGLSDDELRQRFQKEIAKLIELGEIDGIVPIRDQGEHDGVPYFVMPLMEVGSLEDALATGPQGPDAVLVWARRIAEALDALHAHHPPVLHRDVKPANLLFDAKGRAHLADFGIVKELNAAWATTSQNTGIGTPGYMPPEQFLPTREIDARSDQYALAATLYRALSGQTPQYVTTGGHAHRLGQASTAGPGKGRKQLKPLNADDLAPHLPEAAAAAIARGLAEDQEARFPTCSALVEALAAALAPTAMPLRRGPAPVAPARSRPAERAEPSKESGRRSDGPPSREPAVGASHARPGGPTAWPSARPGAAGSGRLPQGRSPRARWIALGLVTLGLLVPAVLLLFNLRRNAAPEPSAAGGTRREAAQAPPARPAPPEDPEAKRREQEALAERDARASAQAKADAEAKAKREASEAAAKDAAAKAAARDTTPPVIEVASPSEAEVTTEAAQVEIAGRVTDAGRSLEGLILIGGGESVALDDTGAFRFVIALEPGQRRTVLLLAQDAAGNTSAPVEVSLRRMAAKSESPVTIELLDPPPGQRVGPSSGSSGLAPTSSDLWTVRIRGRITGLQASDRVRLYGGVELRDRALGVDPGQGEPVSVDSRGAFSVRYVAVVPGDTRLLVEVVNGTAVRAQAEVSVVLERPPTPPGFTQPPIPAWAEPLLSAEQRAQASDLGLPAAFEEPTTGLRFVLVPAGEFLMGSPEGEVGSVISARYERPQHRVKLTPFYLSVFEVTNAQFRRFRPAYRTPPWGLETAPEFATDTDRQPAGDVTHDDAQAFLAWLNQQPQRKGLPAGYRLPSEAQWEYACRAGTATSRFWGDDQAQGHRYANGRDAGTRLGNDGWPGDDGHRVTAPVGSYLPNAWGFYDMLGNVWEWCSDWERAYDAASAVDPEGPPAGERRALRGGSWSSPAADLRAAERSFGSPDVVVDWCGFRVAAPALGR